MIKLLENYLWRCGFSKFTCNSPKRLLKMSCFTNIFWRIQTTDKRQLLSKTTIFRGSAQPAFPCSNLTELKNSKYKINNKVSRTTHLTSFWCFICWLWTDFTPCSNVSIVDFEQVNAKIAWCQKHMQLQRFDAARITLIH